MKQFTLLLVLLVVVKHVEIYAHSNEEQQPPVDRKRLLVNVLRALRKLRNSNVHSENLLPQITRHNDGVQTSGLDNQISKRSKEIRKESTGSTNDHTKQRNGKELFLQLLQTLKSMRRNKNKKQHERTYLSKNYEKQKNKDNIPSTLTRQHEKNQFPDLDKRTGVLKPIQQVAKIDSSQTKKARYSFAQARLSFLQALETAQEEKLTKLGNLERRFSYILPKGNKDDRYNARKEVKYALQNFAHDESATTLSNIRHPYKLLLSNTSQTETSIKHSLLRKPLERENNSSDHIIQEKENNFRMPIPSVTQKENQNKKLTNNKFSGGKNDSSKKFEKPQKIFPSMVDELLSISNARNKLEKLKRLQELKNKLLRHFDKTKEENDESTTHDNFQNMSSWSQNENLNKSIAQNAGTSLFHNLKHKEVNNISYVSKYKNSQTNEYDEPHKRYNERQSFRTDGEKDFSSHVHGLSGKVGLKNQVNIEKPERKTIETYDDFVASSQNEKEPTSTLSNDNDSRSDVQSTLDNSPKSYNSNHGKNTTQNTKGKITHLSGVPIKVEQKPSHHKYPLGYESKVTAMTSLPGTISNNSSNPSTTKYETNHDQYNFEHKINTEIQRHSPDNLAHVEGNHLMSQDMKINGVTQHPQNDKSPPQYSSSEHETGYDESYLPLDSSPLTSQTKTNDSTNPLPSVLSEHDKIISELKASKILSNHLSNVTNEKSHKNLSKILQKAQNMFLEKVKDILAGHKKNGKEKNKNNIVSNKKQENVKDKPKGGVINTSAYVMDESPSQAKTATKTSQDNSGIVPNTPTNDDLMNSLNGNMASTTPQLQNSGTNAPMQSLIQSPMDPNPPQAQSVGQGPPLTFAQQQDAREEERVALEQENAFRMQIGAKSPLNAGNTQYQGYVGLPQSNHYTIQNPGFHAPNVDDLNEYRGGMERYQLSHQLGYGDDINNGNDDEYIPRRNHYRLYGHRVDDEDDEDFDDDENDDDDDIDEGKKKSSIGKPHDGAKKKHLNKHHFKNESNTSKTEDIQHEKIIKPKANTTTTKRQR